MYNPYDDKNREENIPKTEKAASENNQNQTTENRFSQTTPNQTKDNSHVQQGMPGNNAYGNNSYNQNYQGYHNSSSDYWKNSTPPGQTYWQGNYYHYQAPGQSRMQQPNLTAKNEKKSGKSKQIILKVVAGVLACCIISAGSIFGFVSLINNGYVTLNDSSPMFVINKEADDSEGSTTPATTATGELTLQAIAQKVIPSVVCIQNFQISNTYGWGETATDSSGVMPSGEGSGIIATSDGYIITNAHVVDGATSLKVITSDGQSYEAELIGSDSVTDLAVIKIEAEGLTAAEFGSSGDLEVADTVMAIGNPGGMEFNSSVTVGYVSALNRQVTDSSSGLTMNYIQTDAAINPGNSGGALVNMKGQVVGINSAKIVKTGYEGLGFAIPIDDAQSVISDLKNYGYVKDRAALGISAQFIDALTARFYGYPEGMYIASISNSSLTSAGIQVGDVIMEIDGTDVTSSDTITAVVVTKSPGDTVTLTVGRPSTGKTFTATVTLVQVSGN